MGREKMGFPKKKSQKNLNRGGRSWVERRWASKWSSTPPPGATETFLLRCAVRGAQVSFASIVGFFSSYNRTLLPCSAAARLSC
jgi:hypothetical protein